MCSTYFLFQPGADGDILQQKKQESSKRNNKFNQPKKVMLFHAAIRIIGAVFLKRPAQEWKRTLIVIALAFF
jgi:hypothetical protein